MRNPEPFRVARSPIARPSPARKPVARRRRPLPLPAFVLPTYELLPLEPRVLYSAYDIQGVQPASLDQPQINVLFRNSPTGNPLGGDDPDDGVLIKAFLDTGSSGILVSLESAENLPLDRQTYNGQPVHFSDVGVAGDEGFDVSTPYYGELAPVRSIFEDGLPVEAFDQSFGPVRMQISQIPSDDFLSPELNIIGMPGLQGKVVVMDPTPLNSETDLDGMQTYVYSPGTPFNPDGRGVDPGIPNVNRHIKLSYGDFGQFTQTTPAGAPGPTLKDNPFIGPNPVRPAGAVDNTPKIQMTNGTKSASGSFLLDTGAAASFVSQDIANQLGVHYRAGTYGSDDPILVDANNVPVPNQFQLPIGGIGGAVTVAGFRMSSLSLPTVEGDPIRFLDAPVMVLDISVTDPKTGVAKTLDGDFGMNFLVASIDIDGLSLGEGAAGAFDWLTFDQPNGILGLNLPDVAAPPAATDVVISSGSAQRSMVNQVKVDFNMPVASFDAGAFALTRRSTTGGAATAVPFSATLATDKLSATLTFPGTGQANNSLADGNYDLTVVPTKLHDATGLAGSGAAQTMTFHRFFADLDGDGSVGFADFNLLAAKYGKTVPAWTSGDVTGDGAVGFDDFNQLAARYGKSLPASDAPLHSTATAVAAPAIAASAIRLAPVKTRSTSAQRVNMPLAIPLQGASPKPPPVTKPVPTPPPAAVPTLSVNDVAVLEGNDGTTLLTFTVRLSKAAAKAVKVNYATSDGTAKAGSDYKSASGTITFASGQLVKSVTVAVKGDKAKEAAETLFLSLSQLTGPATIVRGKAVGTIKNDD